MEKKAVKFSFRGMNQDVSEGKHPLEFFYEAHNIRFITTSERITGGMAFEKGNELKRTLPSITINSSTNKITLSTGEVMSYTSKNELDTQLTTGAIQTTSGAQTIIGHAITRDSIILFSTSEGNHDAIWKVNMEDYSISLLYLRNLGFSVDAPIQGIYNYENKRIEKVYWVGGDHQIRFINIQHSIANGNLEDLIDVNSNTINVVGNFSITQPVVTSVVSGGKHTTGMIQYAYNLYRLNSSQTKLSPLSDLVPLTKGATQGGGAVNEIVGATPVVEISDIDQEYTHIKIYAVKYTSYNELPSISLLKDKEIPSNRKVIVFDDGSIEAEISLEEFLFLGSEPIIPSHIETKDNIMFASNLKEIAFDVDIDTRAYSFDSGATPNARIYDDVRLDTYGFVTGTSLNVSATSYAVPKKHDAVNLDYDRYKNQANGTTLGGEGKFIKYEIFQNQNLDKPEDTRVLKDNEIYRFGVEFTNRLGQASLPKWMGDYRMPEGNLEGKYNTLKVTFKSDFYVWLNDSANFESEDDKPVGYRILRANRTENDKTILTQGFLNAMMSNFRAEDKSTEFSKQARQRADDGVKMPSLQRVFGKHHTQMEGAKHNLKLDDVNGKDKTREVHKASSSDNWAAETFQYNRLMQMFSPEVLFGNVTLYNQLELRVKGAFKNKETKFWGRVLAPATKKVLFEGKVLSGLTPHEDFTFTNTGETQISGNIDAMADHGIFGPASPSEDDKEMDFYQFYRNFNDTYSPSTTKKSYGVYGSPEIAERGQSATNYNGDPKFQYYNTLQPMLVDGGDGKKQKSAAITSVNSFGAKNITFVLGPDNSDFNHDNRPTLEKLFQDTGIAETNSLLVAEFVKSKSQIYLGGIYGGNSYEDKRRTNYVQIGAYQNISTTTATIDNAGDTYVNTFRFSKIAKTDTEVLSSTSMQITEIVEARIESTIHLKNRNDISLSGWDSRFQPRDEEYHEYNRVYSQQATLVKKNDVDFNFRKIKNFDGRIIATKIKTPGEYIDSWTDFLVNETIDLNGKFGPINGMCSYRDQVYAFQDNALALININPRVQTQADDGIAIELGTGGVLHDYNYITTTSGCINKWGIVVSNNGIYYLDGLNRSIFRLTGEGLEGLSSSKGLHKYLVDELQVSNLRKDNPLLGTGVSMGYDVLNNDVYMTYNNQWTLCFNEKMNEFTGFYSYNSPMYIYTKEKLLTLSPNSKTSLYETHAGKYNEFYGVNEPSSIIFVGSPETDHECTFTNLEWKSVAQDAGANEQRYTWEQIRSYNEYQDSGYRALGPTNMRKLNRKYRVAIPRNKNTTNRIRNNWAFIELTANNSQGYFYVNQDIVLHYIANYIMLR